MIQVVALHGFTGAGASWNAVRSHLPEGVCFAAPDLPGHGTSSDDLPSSFEACVDRLAAWIRHRFGNHTVEPVHVAGYSLGARLALGLLLEHPGLVHSATLIGVRPGLSGPARDGRAARDEALARRIQTEGVGAFVDFWQSLPLFASQSRLPADVLAAQRARRVGHTADGLAWTLRTLGSGRMPDYRQRLGTIARPVHLMAGEADEAFIDLGRQMVDAIERGRRAPLAHGTSSGSTALATTLSTTTATETRLHIVPDAGHNLLLEAPADVAQVIRRSIGP